jgi:hypothetical protein
MQRLCRTCGRVFVPLGPRAVNCSPACTALDRKRRKRKYGTVRHKADRRRWVPAVNAGRAVCSICRLPIQPGSRWHLHHDEFGGTSPAHASCNIRHGAVQSQPAQSAQPQGRLESWHGGSRQW